MPDNRVLIAIEPRSYRDAVALFVRASRPNLDAVVADPNELDAEVVRLTPKLVLCSRVTPILLTLVPDWIVLYPNGAGLVIFSISGRQQTSADLEAERLLELIDESSNGNCRLTQKREPNDTRTDFDIGNTAAQMS